MVVELRAQIVPRLLRCDSGEERLAKEKECREYRYGENHATHRADEPQVFLHQAIVNHFLEERGHDQTQGRTDEPRPIGEQGKATVLERCGDESTENLHLRVYAIFS